MHNPGLSTMNIHLMKRFFYLLAVSSIMVLQRCHQTKPQFVEMEAKHTGVHFVNQLTETEYNNIMTYEYMYNGGGVAVGDLNNDGLVDIYLSGNEVPNKLFLNRGDWKFEEVAAHAKVSGRSDWATGVSMIDINGDGYLDIYLCYSGNAPGEGFNKPVIRDHAKRANELFINRGTDEQGRPSFEEMASEYGLDAPGTFSTQAYFLDYDVDGDLDLFLLNHANMFYRSTVNVKKLRSLRHPYFGNKLYRNDEGQFTEVSEGAGIHGSGLNFGLSAAISDFDRDGWPDIYVTNDYNEQDYFYINGQNGTFKEVSHQVLQHMSKYGMGSDVADVNNDGLSDLFVADMLPEDNKRQKLLKGGDEYDKHNLFVNFGYHHQYMRNTLQLNRGFTSDSLPRFSEVAQLSGVSNTDWSWAPLFADFDNDGYKDLFVTNGHLRDYTNRDFQSYIVDERVEKANASNKAVDVLQLIRQMPSTKVSNYIFRNDDGLRFQNMSDEWGVDKSAISNAAAYADFDNDGDLDLIYSNLNEEVTLLQNLQDQAVNNRYIKIVLIGLPANPQALGAIVTLHVGDNSQMYECYFNRGYQSSVEQVMTIGLGGADQIDRLNVLWPDGRVTELDEVPANQTLTLYQSEAIHSAGEEMKVIQPSLFNEITAISGLTFEHQENEFVDFKYEKLLPFQLSKLGGKMAIGDVNNDGNDDLFFGGAYQQGGKLYLGQEDGTFTVAGEQVWQGDSSAEDSGATFFDANGDGFLDLYVVSGGNEFEEGFFLYQDRLYLGSGDGRFVKSIEALPEERASGSCVRAVDFDQDGDLDLFVGGRSVPGKYGEVPESRVLRNDSDKEKVVFTNVTKELNEGLSSVGMVTDARWVELTDDEYPELVIVGEWMPVKIYRNEEGIKLVDQTAERGLGQTNGWWNTIYPADADQDGDVDLLLGNAGENFQIKTSLEEPVTLYIQDIDQNGKMDPILCHYILGDSYPMASRDELLDQVAGLKKKFLRYESYSEATIHDIIGNGLGKKLETHMLKSAWLSNDGRGSFIVKDLPDEAQFSSVQSFIQHDFDGDGSFEVLAVGNFYPYRVELGKSDASFGTLLSFKNGEAIVKRIAQKIWLNGDIRDAAIARFNSKTPRLVVSRNDDGVSLYQFR